MRLMFSVLTTLLLLTIHAPVNAPNFNIDAYEVMSERQKGREFSWMMKQFDNNELVEKAFEHPHYLTKNSRQSAITNFARY